MCGRHPLGFRGHPHSYWQRSHTNCVVGSQGTHLNGNVLYHSLYWAHLTKRQIKHCKGSVILVNDERSATLSDKAERPEKKRQSAPGFAVKRAVIKSWRVFFWSNQPQKAYRGKDIHCWMPPAQIPAGVIHAPGSHLGWLTTNPTSSFAYTVEPLGHV